MQGYLVLNGGEAFTPRSKTSDYAWMKNIFRESRPRLVVIPAATLVYPEKEAQEAAAYFKNFNNAYVDYSVITDQLSANTHANFEVLDKIDIIALTDGSPADMVERLRGTHTEIALQKMLQRKAVLMGTGASAMALGGVYWLAGQWEPGLGIAPKLAVLPHFNIVEMRLEPERLLKDLPDGITLIGIDDATAAIFHPGGTVEVAGSGRVVVFRDVETQDEYTNERKFVLDIGLNE